MYRQKPYIIISAFCAFVLVKRCQIRDLGREMFFTNVIVNECDSVVIGICGKIQKFRFYHNACLLVFDFFGSE